MRQLMLVDGNNLLCRAYYTPGYQNLSYGGMPTGAVYGFFKMLSNLLASYKPSHMAVCFDSERRCWRNEIYSQYKANRPPTPEDLVPQKKYVRECLTAMGICWLDEPNFEADDIIASIVHAFSGIGIFDHIYVISGDRDLLQLVSPEVTVLIPTKGVSDIQSYTMDNIKELYGVLPHQVPLLKALMGDNSDNIPGIQGVGHKKAVKLIEDYGTWPNILANLHNIKGKIVDNLQAGEKLVPLYEKLTTLSKACPIDERLLSFELELKLEEGYAKLATFGIQKVKFST